MFHELLLWFPVHITSRNRLSELLREVMAGADKVTQTSMLEVQVSYASFDIGHFDVNDQYLLVNNNSRWLEVAI